MLRKLEALIKQGHGGAIIPYSTYFSLVTDTEKGTEAIQSESMNSSPEAQQSENLTDWDITEVTEAIQSESLNSSPEAQQSENLIDWDMTEESLRFDPYDVDEYYRDGCDCDFDSDSSEFEFNSFNPIQCNLFTPYLQSSR